MNSKYSPLIAVALVVIVFGGSLTYCFWPTQSTQEEEFSVTGVVTGLSAYNQPKLDVKADVLTEHGIALGELFTIETEDAVFENAILLNNYLGIFMFDMFVNIESDGYLSIGCVGKLITADKGSEITITHTGTSSRYHSTPLYNKGSTNNRADYSSDETFANFYEVTGGDLKPGILYRSFSPLYDPAKQARSTYVNELAEQYDIQFDIALSYTDETVQAAVESQEGYCITLCSEDKYVAPGMGYIYFQTKEKTKMVMQSMLDNDGAYLVHCNVGRDRTGYMILLLQALCGCTPEEMMECESRAFCNLYHIEVGSEEYKTVVKCTYDRNMFLIAHPEKIPDIFEIDWDNIDVSDVNTEEAAYNYCTSYLGFTDEEISALKEKLCV